MKIALGVVGGLLAVALGVWGVQRMTAASVKQRPGGAVNRAADNAGVARIGGAVPGSAGTSADVANYSQAAVNVGAAAEKIAGLFASSPVDDPPQPEPEQASDDYYESDGTELAADSDAGWYPDEEVYT